MLSKICCVAQTYEVAMYPFSKGWKSYKLIIGEDKLSKVNVRTPRSKVKDV